MEIKISVNGYVVAIFFLITFFYFLKHLVKYLVEDNKNKKE